MADARPRTATHYLHFTCVAAGFESLFAGTPTQWAAGVILPPGVGIDVAPWAQAIPVKERRGPRQANEHGHIRRLPTWGLDASAC
jgi:hypothetical protein